MGTRAPSLRKRGMARSGTRTPSFQEGVRGSSDLARRGKGESCVRIRAAASPCVTMRRMKRLIAALLAAWFIPLTALAYVPNDPDFAKQDYLARVGAPAAWDYARGSSSVIVAILDSGVDLSHPDLKDHIWTNPGEIPGNGIDDDHDGYVDDVHGWDFVENTNDPEPDLSQGWLPDGADHGTIIAGEIAATADNAQGIAGLAFGVQIMPLRIVDAFGRGDSANVVPAIRYAVDHGARVINLSFSGTSLDPDLETEIERAYRQGVVVVAAVGNADGGTDLSQAPDYPACFNANGVRPVIGVAATDANDARASFSNYGGGCVDIAAPGTDVFSTELYRPQYGDFTKPYDDGWSGTSFAAPLVSGAAALLLSVHPTLTPDQIRTILQLSADPITSTGGAPVGAVGAGRLNVGRALQIAGSFDHTGAAVPVAMQTPPPVNGRPAGSPPPSTSLRTGLAGGESSPSAYDRAAANAALPASAPVDSLIRLAALPTVYIVGLDGKRHPFPNAVIFRSWFPDFSSVRTIPPSDMAAIPLGAPVLVRPGTYWVKIASDPRTYFVSPDGYTLRWIKDEAAARALGGPDWASRVIDVEPTYFTKFRQGPDIDQAALSSSWPSGALMEAPGSTDAWYVDRGTRRRVTDLAANHFERLFVRMLAGSWETLPEGLPLSAQSDDVFSRQVLVGG